MNITAKDTTLTGAVIAAVDEQGQTTDKLTLTTDTLTVADLQDTDNSKSMGMDLSLSKNTTKVGGSFNGHEKEQTTKATVGLGNVTVGGTNIGEQPEFADLNRDAANSQETTKDMERGGVDISLTVDNRMLTEKGRDQIAEDILKSGMLVDTAVLAATTDRVGLLDFNEELGKTHTVYETVKDSIANDKVLAKQLQDPNLSAADKEVMLDQLTHAVMSKLGYETEGYENKVFADKTAVAQDENGNLGAVAGFYSEQTGDSYINDANIDDTSGLVRVAGHESSHAMDDQDVKNTGVSYSDSDKETYADNFGSNLASYTNLALDINGYDSGMTSTNNHVGNNAPLVLANTKEYNALDKSEGDFQRDFSKAYSHSYFKRMFQNQVEGAAVKASDIVLNNVDLNANLKLCGGACLKTELEMSRTYGLSSDLASGFGIGVKGGAGIDINIFNQGTAPKKGTITTSNSISGQFLFFGATYSNYAKDQESFQSLDLNIAFPGGFSMDANTGLKAW